MASVSQRVAQANNLDEYINDPSNDGYTAHFECKALREEYQGRCCGLFACCTYSMGRENDPNHVFEDLKTVNRYFPSTVVRSAAVAIAAVAAYYYFG